MAAADAAIPPMSALSNEYTVNLDLHGRRILVTGAGTVCILEIPSHQSEGHMGVATLAPQLQAKELVVNCAYF